VGRTDRRDLALGGRGREGGMEGQGEVFRVFIVETFFPRKQVSGWDRDGKTFSDLIPYLWYDIIEIVDIENL